MSQICTLPLHLLHLPEIPYYVTSIFYDLHDYTRHIPTVVLSSILTLNPLTWKI